jgi:DNA-binding transcriptional ArsR family regulator
VTRQERAVTNPLTDERIIVREFISDLAGSARLEVIRSLDDQHLTASKIEDRGQVTRQTASKHLAQLTDQGLTKSTNSGVYELTAGGKIVLCAFETCFDNIDSEQITHLTRSKHTVPLLHTLSEEPLRPSELTERDPESPSRATVTKDTEIIRDRGLDRGDQQRAPTYAIW